MVIKFDKDASAEERNSYATNTVYDYIVYDLDAWPNNLLNNFKFKNCLFGATNMVNNSDKEKWVYRNYGIAFNEISPWNFGNDFAKNVDIFGFDNT